MAFVRDHGAACIFIPLKMFVGLVSMIVFLAGCFSVVGLMKTTTAGLSETAQSLNIQLGGYSPVMYKIQTIVGSLGIFMGFFGLLGVYDDKPNWLRTFYHYFQVYILCSILVFIFDMYTLRDCNNFMTLADKNGLVNPAMEQLSRQHMCYWGRWAYAVGFGLVTIFELYCLYYIWVYITQLELNPPYPIDFGFERFDKQSRWQFFKVAEPEELPLFKPQQEFPTDSPDDNRVSKNYAPDGSKGVNTYGPDGMRGPAYIRAFRNLTPA